MSATDRATATAVITMLTKAGAKAPPAVAESWKATQRLSEQVREIGIHPGAVYAAVASALTRGDDPSTDPEVQRVLIAGQLTNEGVTAGVDELAYSTFRDTCTEHADAIVEAFRVPFDKAAKELVDTHQVLGSIDLADSGAVLRKGGDAAARWAQATTAVATIDAVLDGWIMLAVFAHTAGNNKHTHVLRMADVTYEQWQTQQLAGRRLTAWEALLAGLTLNLPTYRQYAERVASIEAGAASEAADQADTALRGATGRRPRGKTLIG